MSDGPSVDDLAGRIGRLVGPSRLAVAESITGGRVLAALTAPPGASRYVAGGVVAYDVAIKTTVLGVSQDWVETNGVYNARTARQMAAGVARVCRADLAVATTGVAGPGPADSGRRGQVPAGTFFVGWWDGSVDGDAAPKAGASVHHAGRTTRAGVRDVAVRCALIAVLQRLGAPDDYPA